jgi:hypothetical protein
MDLTCAITPGESIMPRGRRRSGAVALAGVVTSLQAAHRTLVAERESLNTRIGALEGALRAMSAAPVARRGRGPRVSAGGRAFRRGSLKEYIQRVLSSSSGAMAVKDVTAGVMKAGFKSKNKTLAKSVGIALTQMPKVSKVGRGLFRM